MSDPTVRQTEPQGTPTSYQLEQLEILRRSIERGRDLAVGYALGEKPESDDAFVDIFTHLMDEWQRLRATYE